MPLAGPRILFVSEFFPADVETSACGVFQRVRRTMEAARSVATLDALFFWPDDRQLSDDEVEEFRRTLARAWPLNGRLYLVATGSGGNANGWREVLRSARWMMRGAASFVGSRPTLRTAGRPQVDRVIEVLRRSAPNLIVAHRPGALAPLIRCGCRLPPVLVDMDDIEHVKIRRQHGAARAPTNKLKAWLWTMLARVAENAALRRSACCTVCSETDRAELLSVRRRADVRVLPNTAEHSRSLPPAAGRQALFVGVATYFPNRKAIEWLTDEIWPLVRRRCPDAALVLAGAGMRRVVGPQAPAGVVVADFVADLDSLYRQVQIALCPIAFGSGTRIKIIEAAFRGRPVVSTTIGAEGLLFEDETEILIADDAGSFAARICELFEDPARRTAIAESARNRALQEYAPEAVVRRLAGWMREAMAGTAGSRRSG